jgi:hypothetical protein
LAGIAIDIVDPIAALLVSVVFIVFTLIASLLITRTAKRSS